MAYADLAAELAGVIPGLSPLLAATYVRRAWREIRNENPHWSFKTAQASLILPAAITTGTVSRVQFSNVLTFSVAATAALVGYVSGTPLLTQMQIRFGGGSIYRILTVTATNPNLVVTVDRPIVEATNALVAYSVYRAYVAPPVADFTRWDSLEDLANGITITGERLTRTSVWFDAQDPQRTSTGLASYLGALVANPNQNSLPLYELWPHATGGQTFLVTFRRTGAEFVNPGDLQPNVIPDSLIVARALGWHAYPWAHANKGRFPALLKTDFVSLITATRQQYALDLNTIRLQDDDLALESVYNRGHWGGGRRRGTGSGLLGDAGYWQSHPITW